VVLVATAAMADMRPNIVLVMVDDMGFSDLGCYGSEIETPVLDRLAEEGLRFSNTAKCHSSRVSLLSGLWCHQAGNTSLSKAAPLPALLKQAGYATWMVGKWHLKNTPHDFGFEKYFGHLKGSSDYIEGNDTFLLNGKPYKDFGKDASEFYLTDTNTDYAIQFLKEKTSGKDKRPFFLYVAYNAPHSPLQAPEPLVRKYRGRYMEGWEAIRKARFERQKKLGMFDQNLKLPEWPTHQRHWKDLSGEEKSWEDYRRAIYAAMVESIDLNLARLRDELETADAWNNTIFIFLSDNGGDPRELSSGKTILPWKAGCHLLVGTEWASVSNTPFRWYKQNAHRGGVSTPCIIHWPAGLKAKGWNETPAHLVDLMPTLLKLAGVDYPAEFDGKATLPLAGESLVPVIQKKMMTRQEAIYYNYYNNVGLREGRYKLVSARGGPWELYDLIDDPVEVNNLASAQPERVAAMSAEWYRMAEVTDGAPIKDRKPRAASSVTWGINAHDNRYGKKGSPRRGEQPPNWEGKQPPLPLPARN